MLFVKSSRAVLVAAVGLLFTTVTLAQDAAPAPPVFVRPAPLLLEGRFFPGFGDEGIITARYTVKADGTTGDIEILGGFTNAFYENIIKTNIANWIFTPGTVNGEPKDFLNQEHIFKLRVAETLAISGNVQKEIEGINKNLSEQNYAGALATISQLQKNEVHSVLDYALLNHLLASAQIGLNDPFAALAASQRATQSALNIAGEREYMLLPELLEVALKRRLMMAASVRQQGEVLRTWEALDALYDVPADDAVQQWVATAREQLAATDQLGALAKITEDKHWVHVPTHRIFTVTDVREGKLDEIVAYCDRQTLEIDYMENVDWTLPPAAGDCKLDFRGSNGTLFSVYEFPQ
jgi:hypothetical protein